MERCNQCDGELPEDAVVENGRKFCDEDCRFDFFYVDPYEPIDYDEQDRRAAAEERIENFRRER